MLSTSYQRTYAIHPFWIDKSVPAIFIGSVTGGELGG